MIKMIENFISATATLASYMFIIIVWRIFGYSNIFEYFPIRIFVRIIFVSFFWYEYIRIFVRMLFLDTNIFVYSFVSFFWYEYIRIFVRMVFNIRIYLCQLKLLFGSLASRRGHFELLHLNYENNVWVTTKKANL